MMRRAVILALSLVLGATAAQAAEGETAASPPLSPLDAYAEAAATTILAEQNCPGTHLKAGRLTTLRLAAKVAPAQEATLEAKLRSRATELRRRLAAEGKAAFCDAALDAFGPQGSVAKDVLVR
ncbi:hypothetical protein ACFQE0_16165 [Methylobacterium komagatae]|uniref:UrcA family protein n=1 Tax=Methylobacterium komagatae TaxID=374425 RepID=A0ABW2BKX6_9HYPH